MAVEVDEVVLEFLSESRENLDHVEHDLVRLEDAADDPEAIGRIFRAVHTIKGTCGFFGYERLEAVSHAGESVLSGLRDRRLALTTRIATALLTLVDALRAMLDHIERTGEEAGDEYTALVIELRALEAGEGQPDRGAAPGDEGPAPSAEGEAGGDVGAGSSGEAPAPEGARDASAAESGPTPAGSAGSPSGPRAAPVAASPREQRALPSEATVRVRVEVLDELLNLVGELVLARNQLVQVKEAAAFPALNGPLRRLDSVTSELQERAMQTRMQPVKTVWNALPRVVRDLALQCGKEVQLELEGEETGLDRSLIEAVKDPITHIVRNAIDHGIERPEERVAAGKGPVGRLRITAHHEGGYVIMGISDDGGGIDPERLRRKAIEKGLVTDAEVARLDDDRARQLIFHPGFSTAQAVTNISGRGVGMDVVKTNIERIGGSVELDSEVGRGTTLRVRVPLTLAIVPALLVATARERFAIPQVNLMELVQLEEQEAAAAIEYVGDAPVFRLRGRLLPLVWLRDQLGLGERGAPDGLLSIAVLQAYDQLFGLVVDVIHDTEEIVVKPLAPQVDGLDAFSGATILGDGSVALILDPVGLARLSGVDRREVRAALLAAETAGVVRQSEERTYLVCRTGGRHVAVPVDRVVRLESVAVAKVEAAGNARVVQYRGDVLPLYRVGDQGARPSDEDMLQVVVCRVRDDLAGLVVDDILDVEGWSGRVAPIGDDPEMLGTAVLDGRVVEVVDLDRLERPPDVAAPVAA